jgi:hypothetical protein
MIAQGYLEIAEAAEITHAEKEMILIDQFDTHTKPLP